MSALPTASNHHRTGLIAGLLNGLIGIGGGIVIVPALLGRGYTPQQAVGTSLATVVVLSGIAFFGHAAITGIALDAIAFAGVVLGGVTGSLLGGWLLARISRRNMMIIFSLLLFVVALRLVLQGLGLASIHALWPAGATTLGYAGVGFVAGILSGVFGVGGGALVMLGLVVLFGLPVQQGLPVALAANVTNAIAGAVNHSVAGRVRATDITRLIPAALVGIAVGTALAVWLPGDTMRVIIGGFFCAQGIRMLVQIRHSTSM